MKKALLNTTRGSVCYWMSDSFSQDKKTMALLHGLSADHTLFDKQIPHFEGEYNLIVWDAPAHGLSRPYTDFTYPNAAADLRQLLLDNGVSSAIMAGQSMGGYIIQSFIKRYPEMVDAFIGIDTCPYGEDYYSKSDKWWLRQMEWMSALYPLDFLKKSVAKQCACTEYARENMLCALKPYDKKELCHLMGIGYAGFLSDNCDMYIPCPTLIIVGEYDRTGKVRSYCCAWAEKTGFPLVTVKDAAHNSNADAPQAVNEAISAFLRGIEKSF